MKRLTLARTSLALSLALAVFSPLTGLAASTGAQLNAPSRQTATAPAAKSATSPFVSQVLPNGLEVIVVEDHSVPLVTVELAVRNGSYTEPPELNGLSHLYEHMFFKTNKAVADRESYLATIGQLGIVYNGSTETETVQYYFSTTSPNLRTAMRFMRDSALYPLFEKGEFEREREVVIGEMDRNESNPYFYLNRGMNDRLFYKYPSRKNPLGNRKTVQTATTDMMRLIQSRYYVPNNSAVIVTGDAKPADVYKVTQEMFGTWKKTENPFVKFPLVEHPALKGSEGSVITQPVQNVVLNLGWQGPSIGKDNAATYAADVFSYILTQPNSKLQRRLVDSGLATGVSIGYLTQRNVGPINIIAQTTPDRARECLKAIYEEIGKFNDPSYYTDKQLEDAKSLLEAEDLYSREKLSEYVHTVAFWWASTGLDYYRGYQDNLKRTSRADISRYVSTYIQNQPHVGLALMSPDTQQQLKLTPAELTGDAR